MAEAVFVQIEEQGGGDAEAYCEWLSAETQRVLRLPTEKEWEYACRCGRRGLWIFGDDAGEGSRFAWTESNSGQHLHPVRQLESNAWGLFDMHGNESEWCITDASDVGAGHAVVRGGGFLAPLSECRSDSRRIQARSTPDHGAVRIDLELP